MSPFLHTFTNSPTHFLPTCPSLITHSLTHNSCTYPSPARIQPPPTSQPTSLTPHTPHTSHFLTPHTPSRLTLPHTSHSLHTSTRCAQRQGSQLSSFAVSSATVASTRPHLWRSVSVTMMGSTTALSAIVMSWLSFQLG